MPAVTVASFNTHYGFRPRPSRPRTPYDLHAAIGGLGADVIVVQELLRPDGRRGPIDEVAGALGLTVIHETIGWISDGATRPRLVPSSMATTGVAVLTRLPARRVRTIALGPTPRDPAPNRKALHVEVDVAGSALQLVAVHLTSKLPHGPLLQLRRLATDVPGHAPAVVAGDCNFWGPGVSALLRGWRRAVRGRTWPARWPHSQIDHILVRPEMRVVRAQVLGNVGSDHRPVRAELAW